MAEFRIEGMTVSGKPISGMRAMVNLNSIGLPSASLVTDTRGWVMNSSTSSILSSDGSSRAHFSFRKSNTTFEELCFAGFRTQCTSV